ncbi:MAG: trans-2-enoyl-CoA reductase [Bacteroidia bacterium]|jgi:trans-2-enoyl-CoA reductase
MINKQAAKYIFILGVTIYAIVGFERWMSKETHESDIKRKYEQEKTVLKQKIYKNEIEQLKEEAIIDGMSNDELDSTWATIFG